MQRKTFLAWPVVCVLILMGCSGAPQSALSPSAVDATATFINPDGSTMKVRAPRDLAPNGTIDSQRPTLTFSNSVAVLVQVNLGHELEILNAQGASIYNRTLPESATTSSHAVESDLPYAETFTWRVRARSGINFGPWATASIRTPNPPPPPAPPTGVLPFPVPEACGPFGPDGRFPCVLAMAAQSVEWQRCAAGSGLGCHRFVRQVVHALSRSDPNFQMILVGGGHGCNCDRCGDTDRATFYREDTTVYGGRRVYDMITGAGGPTPGLTWSFIGDGGPRPGDVPADAALCTP
jgi:hypothetical protein